MQIIKMKYIKIVYIINDLIIKDVEDILKLMVSAHYNHNCNGIILHEKNLDKKFFDLKSGFAGEILQKFSNYNMKLAIIGDFRKYKSKSLDSFIYECNNGNRVFFQNNLEKAVSYLDK